MRASLARANLLLAFLGATLTPSRAGVAAPSSSLPPRGAATLGTREMILVNQVGFARGTARWRARELYRLVHSAAGGDGTPQAVPLTGLDRSRAIFVGAAALRRDLHEERVLAEELAHVRAARAAIARLAPIPSAADGRTPPPSSSASPASMVFWTPVSGVVDRSFGALRDPATGAWVFRAGMRLRARPGEPVSAPAGGTVRRVEDTAASGMALVLSHQGGWTTILGGLAGVQVVPGQQVKRREAVAAVPPGGRVTVEVWRGLSPVDPSTLMRRD